MGFRTDPLTTPTGLDTGGTGQRVVITETGGREGGGAVLLYPNTTDDPGSLEAGNDADGALAALHSPPNVGGIRSSLILTGTDNPATDGAYLESAGGIRFVPATGRAVIVDGALQLNSWQFASPTTDANGVVTITHGLGYTPGVVFLQSRSTAISPITIGLGAITATTFQIRIYQGTSPAASVTVPIAWLGLK